MFENFGNLFTSREKREKEQRDYAHWAFPYGDAQKEAVQKLLEVLFPDLDTAMRLFYYLTAKEVMEVNRSEFSDPASREDSIPKILKGLKQKGFHPLKTFDRAKYCALAQLEWAVGPDLVYPDAGQVIALAGPLEKAFENAPKKKKKD